MHRCPATGERYSRAFPYESLPAFLVRCAICFVLIWSNVPTVSAAAPTLTHLFPAGGQQGQAVEVQLGGSFDPWPVEVWTDAPKIKIKPGTDKGRLTVAIGPDVPVGTYWMRLYNAEGASDLRPFLVGSLKEILEIEPNDDPKKPQRLPPGNAVVNGRLTPANDVDHFALELKKGQTLVASLQANSILRSPMDGHLQIVSSDGFVLRENNDFRGLDPQIAFEAPRDGVYLVRVFAFPASPDSSIRFAGAETYIYRLTLTTGGFADHAYPLAVALGRPATIEMRGWNIPEAAKKLTPQPASVVDQFWVRHPEVSNPVEICIEPHPCIVEIEPNDRAHPQKVEPPVTISAHIDPTGDIDIYEFKAQKGKVTQVRIDARKLGSELDAVLRITDPTGKVLQEVNEKSSAADPNALFSAPVDGNYRVEVRDLYSHGGDRYYYRLRLTAPAARYALGVAGDRFVLTAGEPLEVPVTIERFDGHTAPISIKAELPDGVSCDLVNADAKAKMVKLKLTAKTGPISGPMRIVGSAPGGADSISSARAKLPVFDISTESLWLTVKNSKK